MQTLFSAAEQSFAQMWAVLGIWLAENATIGKLEGQGVIGFLGDEASFQRMRWADIRQTSMAVPLGANRHRLYVHFENRIEGSAIVAEVTIRKEGESLLYESMIISKSHGLGPVPWVVGINTECDEVVVLQMAPATARMA